MERTDFEDNPGSFEDIAKEMVQAMELGRGQPLNADCVFATPSDAYLTFLELVKQTIPEEKIEALIKARGARNLEGALTPDFVSNLAMAELNDVLKLKKT